MSISDAASLILKVTNIAKDGEIFILKMPSVNILNLGKTMMSVYKSRNPKSKIAPIKISKIREKERMDEFLITPTEIPFCHDMGTMYKISKDKSVKKLLTKEFNSETAVNISKTKLKSVIKELLDNYLPF
mgnify:CR=1 FL=1